MPLELVSSWEENRIPCNSKDMGMVLEAAVPVGEAPIQLQSTTYGTIASQGVQILPQPIINRSQIWAQGQESCQLEVENIHSESSPQESLSLAHQSVLVPSQLVTEPQVQSVSKQQNIGVDEHVQTTKSNYEVQSSIGEFKNKGQHEEKINSKEIHMEEILANHKDREKQVDGPLKKDQMADECIAKVG